MMFRSNVKNKLTIKFVRYFVVQTIQFVYLKWIQLNKKNLPLEWTLSFATYLFSAQTAILHTNKI